MQALIIAIMVTISRSKAALIGSLAKRTGVNIETIRYYERAELLPSPPRSDGGHRLYDDEHFRRLNFIRRGRGMGFSLHNIRALLALADDGKTDCCAEAKKITLRHLDNVRAKLTYLTILERALKSMTDACHPDDQSSCPVFDSLNAIASDELNEARSQTRDMGSQTCHMACPQMADFVAKDGHE